MVPTSLEITLNLSRHKPQSDDDCHHTENFRRKFHPVSAAPFMDGDHTTYERNISLVWFRSTSCHTRNLPIYNRER